jgi:hypothetical protein
MAEKKSAWTGLDRVDFKKISSKSQCSNQKIGVDRSRESKKKASSAASVFKKFIFTTGHGSAFDKRCSSCYTLPGCVFADIQSRDELNMLLQAKRQPGDKIPGRVVDRAYRFYDTNDKIGYEKLKEITWCCSWLLRYNLSDRCPPRKFPSIIKCKAFKSKMQVKDFKKNINVTIFNLNKSKILKRT